MRYTLTFYVYRILNLQSLKAKRTQMKNKLNLQVQLLITGVFTLITSIFIGLEYFRGGVAVHYLFHNKDLPGFSNWWGLLIIPTLTFICVRRVKNRLDIRGDAIRFVYLRFIAAFLFSVIVTMAFAMGYDPTYLMLLPFVIALFYPLYRSEFLLGFVIGSLYTVGAFIPTLFGIVLLGIYFCLYRLASAIRGLFKIKKPVV